MTHHTNRVRKGEVDLQAMIDINKMIMEGLSVTPSVQSEASLDASKSVKMQVGV